MRVNASFEPSGLTGGHRLHGVARLALVLGISAALASPALAQKDTGATNSNQSRIRPLDVKIGEIRTMAVSPDGVVGGVSPRGTCPPAVSSHTDANFQGGSFTVQAGFAQTEIAAVSFVLPAAAFPIKVDLAEMIFATMASSVQTTTEWSFLVWSGTPATGILEYEFNSDGTILPHLVIPPGTNGVNVQVSVDPEDPDQIILQDPGNHTFSIGYRIDVHNQQTQNPCFTSPPTCCNAFPTTDTSGLANPTNNWLFGVNCGSLGCPTNGGWASFSQLSSFCRPSGDWVIRVTWESVNCGDAVGACCLAAGGCDIRTQQACSDAGGTYRGDNVPCGNANCASPTQACCFQATGGCLNLSPENCAAAGGIPAGIGTTCATFVCFPTGACCLPNGSCIGPVSPSACAEQNGAFQGNNTACGTVNCPIPTGACCFGTGFCLNLSQAECTTGGGTFHGIGTQCGKSTCNPPECTCDFNDSGTLNSQDFFDFLACFFTTGCTGADFNDDGQTNSQDFFDFLNCFFSPPPGC
jgi:hypothetical protein